MTEKLIDEERLTDEEIIARQERLYELELDCSTSRNLRTDEARKRKIDALLDRAQARKKARKHDD